MTFIDFLTGRKPAETTIGQFPIQRKSFTVASNGLRRFPTEPGTDTEDLIVAYRKNQLVRACVDILANAVTDPRIMVERRANDGDWEEVVGHPLRQLLIMPNPEMDEAMFFNFAQTSIEVAGVFYAEIVRSAALPVELWPLQPTDVKPKYKLERDGRKTLTHYEYSNGTFQKDIKPEDMMVRDDLALGGRLSPLASGMRHVDSDLAQSDYVRGFFMNAGVPSGILKIHGREIDQEESDRLRVQWRAKYGRESGGSHDVAVLDENADYERIGALLNELDSQTLRGFDESRISMAFGVPPLIVYAYIGLLRSTYSNLDEAWRQFWLTTMSTKLKMWRSFLTVSLLGEFENIEDVKAERSRLAWDMSMVGALQEEVDQVLDRERKFFMSGGSTLDEYRGRSGVADYSDPEMGGMNYFQLKSYSLGTAVDVDPNADENDIQGNNDNGGQAALNSGIVVKNKLPRKSLDDFDIEQAKEILARAMLEMKIRNAKPARLPSGDGLRNRDLYFGGSNVKVNRAEQQALDDYGEQVYNLAKRARSGEMEKDDFIKQLRQTSKTNLVALFLMGSLLEDDEVTDEEIASINWYIERAKESAKDFGDDIYNGRYGEEDEEEPDSFSNRAALWGAAAGAVLVIGRTWRRDDPELTWRRGPTEQPCDDCLAFEGTTMRASLWRTIWDQGRLPQGRDLECAGFNCLCDLIDEG